MTVQELINVLSHIENKNKPVYLFDIFELGTIIEKEITDTGDLENRFELYID